MALIKAIRSPPYTKSTIHSLFYFKEDVKVPLGVLLQFCLSGSGHISQAAGSTVEEAVGGSAGALIALSSLLTLVKRAALQGSAILVRLESLLMNKAPRKFHLCQRNGGSLGPVSF